MPSTRRSRTNRTVVLCSGHMIDAADRREPRFPPSKEGVVRAELAALLDRWGVGEGDLAIAGGARGADLIFSELCLNRGAQLHLHLSLPMDRFLAASVELSGSDWVSRFHAVKERGRTSYLHELEGAPPKGGNEFSQTNRWMLSTAREESKGGRLLAVLIWDEKPQSDGPGGTANLAQQLSLSATETVIINPTLL